ncbi:MAG: hypothetical protein RI981_68, partial [Bacteroidota bacterium]
MKKLFVLLAVVFVAISCKQSNPDYQKEAANPRFL